MKRQLRFLHSWIPFCKDKSTFLTVSQLQKQSLSHFVLVDRVLFLLGGGKKKQSFVVSHRRIYFTHPQPKAEPATQSGVVVASPFLLRRLPGPHLSIRMGERKEKGVSRPFVL